VYITVIPDFGQVLTFCKKLSELIFLLNAHIATLTVNKEQYAGAALHHKYMGSAAYRKKCSIRAGAESLVNEIANVHGARKSRHKTEDRSRLQLIFASIACNVKRYIKYKGAYAQNQTKLAVVNG